MQSLNDEISKNLKPRGSRQCDPKYEIILAQSGQSHPTLKAKTFTSNPKSFTSYIQAFCIKSNFKPSYVVKKN
jgi:hypothetical protein